MPWLTCTRCGWYQSLGKFCASCASPMPSSAGRRPGRQNTRAPAPGASSPAKPAGPVTPELLQQRWDAARRSAQQPGHTKVELICSACHSRTFNHKSECKACKLPLATAYTLLPCQWPPLGVPASVMQRHEPGSTNAPEPPAQPVPKPGVPPVESPPANTSLDHLTVAQLRAEIGQMEKFVKDCENKTSPPCVLMQQTLVSYRQALAGRKSVGLRLDAAAQKHAAATKARQVAEEQLSSARRAVTQAEQALAQARHAETEAEQAHNDQSSVSRNAETCHRMCLLQFSTPWLVLAFSHATWPRSPSSWAMSSRMALCRSHWPWTGGPAPTWRCVHGGRPRRPGWCRWPCQASPLHWPSPAQRGGPAPRTAAQPHAGDPGGNAPAGAQPTQTSERGWLGCGLAGALGGCVASSLSDLTGPAPAAWQRPCAAVVWCISTCDSMSSLAPRVSLWCECAHGGCVMCVASPCPSPSRDPLCLCTDSVCCDATYMVHWPCVWPGALLPKHFTSCCARVVTLSPPQPSVRVGGVVNARPLRSWSLSFAGLSRPWPLLLCLDPSGLPCAWSSAGSRPCLDPSRPPLLVCSFAGRRSCLELSSHWCSLSFAGHPFPQVVARPWQLLTALPTAWRLTRNGCRRRSHRCCATPGCSTAQSRWRLLMTTSRGSMRRSTSSAVWPAKSGRMADTASAVLSRPSLAVRRRRTSGCQRQAPLMWTLSMSYVVCQVLVPCGCSSCQGTSSF